jgi:hypothetical protein
LPTIFKLFPLAQEKSSNAQEKIDNSAKQLANSINQEEAKGLEKISKKNLKCLNAFMTEKIFNIKEKIRLTSL